MNPFKKYLGLIDEIVTDFLTDLKSHRVVLSWVAIGFNLLVLFFVTFKGLDWKALTVSFPCMMVVYGFYYKSKSDQAQIEANSDSEDTDPSTERDPDKE